MVAYDSFMEIDMREIERNVEKIRKGIGEKEDIFAILKGNAYGLGLVPIAKHLAENCGITSFGCAQVYEALQLRAAIGIKPDILVVGGVPFHNIPAAVAHDLHTPAYNNAEYLKRLDIEAKKQGKRAVVHIKVETGLNRIGALPGEELEELCLLLKELQNIDVIGAYTHFPESEVPDKSSTNAQFALFKTGMKQIQEHGFSLKYVHASNSAASSWLRDPILTHVRPAGLMLGYDPNENPINPLNLKEVMSWRTFVTSVKWVKSGETVGYNQAFHAKKATKVAMCSVGYGDGYYRNLAMSGEATVLIKGKRVPIIAISMDQMFLNITDADVDIALNEIVTLIGQDGEDFISVFELQKIMKQSYLVVTSILSDRINRIYNYA